MVSKEYSILCQSLYKNNNYRTSSVISSLDTDTFIYIYTLTSSQNKLQPLNNK